jgi:hypothetical protein
MRLLTQMPMKRVVNQESLNRLSHAIGIMLHQKSVDALHNGFSHSAFRHRDNWKAAGIGLKRGQSKGL